jgi:hypothetical protein
MIGQQMFKVHFGDLLATADAANGYKQAILLPAGQIWQIDGMYVQAATNYAAVASNYLAFTLRDSSGYAICDVSNSDSGVAIGPHITGADTSATAAYKRIDCSDAAGYVYVDFAAAGNGRAMLDVSVTVLATPLRGV